MRIKIILYATSTHLIRQKSGWDKYEKYSPQTKIQLYFSSNPIWKFTYIECFCTLKEYFAYWGKMKNIINSLYFLLDGGQKDYTSLYFSISLRRGPL